MVRVGLGPGPGNYKQQGLLYLKAVPQEVLEHLGQPESESSAVEGGPYIGRVGGPILGTQHEGSG